MDHLAQELSFFNFEDLSQDDRAFVEGILTGNSSNVKQPELPWAVEEPLSDYEDEPYEVEGGVPNGPALATTMVPPMHGPPPPPGTIYTTGIPAAVVPGMPPQVISYPPGTMILPQPGGIAHMPVPLSYMQMMPPTHPHGMPPGVPSMAGVPVTVATVPPMANDYNNQQNQVPMNQEPTSGDAQRQDKRDNAGKPYERRNKKKRPPDYYEKLQARESGSSSRESPETSRPGPAAASTDINGPENYQEPSSGPPKLVPNTGPGQIPLATAVPMVNQTGTGPVPQHHITTVPPPTHRGPASVSKEPSPARQLEQPPQIHANPEMLVTKDMISSRNDDATELPQLVPKPQPVVPPNVSQDISFSSQIYKDASRTCVSVNNTSQQQQQQAIVVSKPDAESGKQAQYTAGSDSTNAVAVQPVDSKPPLAPVETRVLPPPPQQQPRPEAPIVSIEPSQSANEASIPPPPAVKTAAFTAPEPAAAVMAPVSEQQQQQPKAQSPPPPAQQPAPTPEPLSPVSPITTNTSSNTALTTSAPTSPSTMPMASPTQAAADKPKVSSWAGLFHGTSTAASATVIYDRTMGAGSGSSSAAPSEKSATSPKPSPEPEGKTSSMEEREQRIVPASEDKAAKQLGGILKNHKLMHRSVSLQPRGLFNKGNWCYVNATLQALLACPPFYHLVKALPLYPALTRGASSTPVIDSLVEFINEFSPMPYKPIDKSALNAKGTMKLDIQPGPGFEPAYVYKMLQVINYDAAFKHGRQEDAEEFLSCLLNGLHDEMVAAIKVDEESKGKTSTPSKDAEVTTNGGFFQPPGEGEEGTVGTSGEEEGWEQVGPKNKSVVTRTAKFDSSPISEMLRGQIRSVLHQPGSKESATLEPFFTLQLDVQGKDIRSVDDALEGLMSKETLQGYTCAKTKQEVDATRRLLLEELPPVLVLHLKWFSYDKSGGMQKNVKQVDFSVDLDINKDLLSPNVRMRIPATHRKYKLFAVVNHLGGRAVGGHYIADVFHPGVNGWVRCDDSNIHIVPINKVLKFVAPKVPYLLYYRRLDLN